MPGNYSTLNLTAAENSTTDLDSDYQDLRKLLQDMSNRRTSSYEDFILNDDFYFARRPAATSEFFPISVLILTLICMVGKSNSTTHLTYLKTCL